MITYALSYKHTCKNPSKNKGKFVAQIISIANSLNLEYCVNFVSNMSTKSYLKMEQRISKIIFLDARLVI